MLSLWLFLGVLRAPPMLMGRGSAGGPPSSVRGTVHAGVRARHTTAPALWGGHRGRDGDVQTGRHSSG